MVKLRIVSQNWPQRRTSGIYLGTSQVCIFFCLEIYGRRPVKKEENLT